MMGKKTPTIPKSDYIKLFQVVMSHSAELSEHEPSLGRPYLHILGTGSHVESPDGIGALRRIDIGSPAPGLILPSLLIVGDGVTAFRRLIRLFESTVGIGDAVDVGHIRDRVTRELQQLSLDSPPDEAAWQIRIEAFIKSLRGARHNCRVVLPVINLYLNSDLEVGNVKFRPRGFIETEVAEPILEYMQAKSNPQEEKEDFLVRTALILKAIDEAPCCACLTVTAHESRASDLAYHSARTAINLLRCYIPVLYDTHGDNSIGLLDDSSVFHAPAVVYPEQGGHNVQTGTGGPKLRYELSEEGLTFLRKHGAFDQISCILGKAPIDRSQLEDAIVTAIWWIGTGNHWGAESQQAVAVATGLESLLIHRKGVDIAETLALHSAHLIASSVEEKESVYKKVKFLYDLRSRVVHSGEMDMPEEALSDLKYYALAILVEVAKRSQDGWKQVGDLAEAVRRAGLGGDPVARSVELIPRGPQYRHRIGKVTTHDSGRAFMMQW